MGLPDNTVNLRLPSLDQHSERARVGTEDRLQLPKGMISAMSWWHHEKGHVGVELVEDGLFRVMGLAALAVALEGLRTDRMKDLADEHERRMAIRDKYRKMAITKDARLQMTVDVLALMGLTPITKDETNPAELDDQLLGDPRVLFVQPAGDTLEVMTAEFRRRRRDRFREVSVNLHLE